MKKFLSVFLSASFVFCPLFSGLFVNRVKADTEIPSYAEFEENSVIATIDYNISRVRLYSAEPTLEELGITDVKQLNINSQSEISAFSAYTEPMVCEMTLAEPGRENVLETVQKLNGLSYIKNAEPNYIYRAFADEYIPNDPQYSRQYSIKAVDAAKTWYLAESEGIDCSDIAVAVIDSGINLTHEDLKDNLWVNPGETVDGTDSDGNGVKDDIHGWNYVGDNNDPTDENGHGSHVSGIISAATNNGVGVASLPRNAKIAAFKVLNAKGEGDAADIIKAVYYIKKAGIKIVNCSLGGYDESRNLKSAIESCGDTLFVCAAGNDTFDNDSFGTEERMEGTETITVSRSYPASFDCSNILSVASTGYKSTTGGYYDVSGYNLLSDFSNYGAQSVDIAAPGGFVTSAAHAGVSSYGRGSGTSQAAPLVSSVAVLIKAAKPDITPEEIIEILMSSSDKLDLLNGKVKSGGKLNAYKALLAAIPTPEPTAEPTAEPTIEPTTEPTTEPTASPTAEPTAEPTASPTVEPTAEPTAEPTTEPTAEPTASPTAEPTAEPTTEPTAKPTVKPVANPTVKPTAKPTLNPTVRPILIPTVEPTASPTAEPTASPTLEPTSKPTIKPTAEPTLKPTIKPTLKPTAEPTAQPTASPTLRPTVRPTASPTVRPILIPTFEPTASPMVEPTIKPTIMPTLSPTAEPTAKPTSAPVVYSIKYKNGGAVVTSPKEGVYCVVFAAYKNGALTAVKTAEAVFADAGELTVTPTDFNADNTDSVKVMLWETLYGMRPLCVSDMVK